MEFVKIEEHHRIYEEEAIREVFAQVFIAPTIGRIKSAAQSGYAKQQGLFYVAKEGESILGIIGCRQVDQSYLEIMHLVVDKAHRNKGIGRYMIEKILDVTRVPVMTMDADYKEMTYLEKIGFKVKDMSDSGLDQFKCTFTSES